VFSYVFNSVVGIAVASAYGLDAGEFVSLAIAAPFFEEIFKGAALLVLLLVFRSHFDNVLDGIVYGALVGLGFAMTENIIYFGRAYFEAGIFGIGFLFVLRVVIGGLGHALYTAIFGATLGWARSQYGVGRARFIVPLAGLSAAMLLHSAWNTTAFFAGRIASDDQALLAILIILFVEPLLFILPGAIAIVVIAVITSRRELAIIQHELREEIHRGVLSETEYQQVSHGSSRRKASLAALRTGGFSLWLAHRKFVRLSAQLAFQKYHVSQGEIGKRGLRYRSPDQLRSDIVETRGIIYRRNPAIRTIF
jgi:protease PrsW